MDKFHFHGASKLSWIKMLTSKFILNQKFSMASIALFAGAVPANYDKYLGPILFEPYALDLVERLRANKVKHLLELACGTGRVTKHLVELIPADGSLIATDLNPGML